MAERTVVSVRYFAAAAEAAGVRSEDLPVEHGATVGDLEAEMGRRHGEALVRVLATGSFLVDGVVTVDRLAPVGGRVDVLPPFSGG